METVTKPSILVELSILNPFVKKLRENTQTKINLNRQVREFLLKGTFLALKEKTTHKKLSPHKNWNKMKKNVRFIYRPFRPPHSPGIQEHCARSYIPNEQELLYFACLQFPTQGGFLSKDGVA